MIWYALSKDRDLMHLEANSFQDVKKYLDFFYPNEKYDIGELDPKTVIDTTKVDYDTATPGKRETLKAKINGLKALMGE